MSFLVDGKNRISREAVERMLRGEKLNGHGIKIRVDSVGRKQATFSVSITDEEGIALATFAKATCEVGDDLTILQLQRAFNIDVGVA